MKRSILSLLILLTGATAYAATTVDEVLKRLDESLEHKADYERQKRDAIGLLQAQLRQANTDSARYAINAQLFRQYSSYQYDSAYVYADRCIQLAEKTANPDWLVQSRCFRVFSLMSAGLYKEAFDEFEPIDPTPASPYYRYFYYGVASRLYYDACDYNHASAYQPKYIRKGGEMTDSLLHYLPAEAAWMRDYYQGVRLMKEFKGRESVPVFQRFLKQPIDDNHLKAIATSSLGWIYLFENKEEEAISYLAEAAIFDNETTTKETTALCVLGGLLYKRGDVERAMRYVQLALDDANFYDARHRLIQVGQILPIIEQDRYDMLKHQRNLLLAIGAIALLFVLCLLAALYFFRRQNRQLSDARRQLEASNTQLSEANSQLSIVNCQLSEANCQLSEANHIKDEYIGRTFYINAEYIKRVEKLYKMVDRKIVARQYEDLRQSLKESTLNNDRENMYSAFDETFLKIFPDFVARFNEMFSEQDRRLPDEANTLTPEMRIFALIRLGISDSERIANFLNYSVHTISTYKTRVKNKSIVANDEFEQRIMEI